MQFCLNPNNDYTDHIRYICYNLEKEHHSVYTESVRVDDSHDNRVSLHKELLDMDFDYISHGYNDQNKILKDFLMKHNKYDIYVAPNLGGRYHFYAHNGGVSRLNEIVQHFKDKFEYIPDRKRHINLITVDEYGLSSNLISLSHKVFHNEAYPYVDSNSLLESINSGESGIILFHGKPGTGKSSYLQYMINSEEYNAKWCYLDSSLLKRIRGEHLLKFLLSHTTDEKTPIVMVCEDCEDILKERSDVTSMILNLTDGLLSQSINFKFIGTFNCDVDKIDRAILRKGRLMYKQEFLPLNNIESKSLADKLEIDSSLIVEDNYVLTDIYNIQAESFENKKKGKVGKIGFL